jgi:hypothetical protein
LGLDFNLIEQAFAKLKALLQKAAERSIEKPRLGSAKSLVPSLPTRASDDSPRRLTPAPLPHWFANDCGLHFLASAYG